MEAHAKQSHSPVAGVLLVAACVLACVCAASPPPTSAVPPPPEGGAASWGARAVPGAGTAAGASDLSKPIFNELVSAPDLPGLAPPGPAAAPAALGAALGAADQKDKDGEEAQPAVPMGAATTPDPTTPSPTTRPTPQSESPGDTYSTIGPQHNVGT